VKQIIVESSSTAARNAGEGSRDVQTELKMKNGDGSFDSNDPK
jgi:hypothetical protein